MMRRTMSALASAFILAASALPHSSPLPGMIASPVEYRQPRTWRNRFPGRARPAGTKLARKAFKGRVGLATIR